MDDNDFVSDSVKKVEKNKLNNRKSKIDTIKKLYQKTSTPSPIINTQEKIVK